MWKQAWDSMKLVDDGYETGGDEDEDDTADVDMVDAVPADKSEKELLRASIISLNQEMGNLFKEALKG